MKTKPNESATHGSPVTFRYASASGIPLRRVVALLEWDDTTVTTYNLLTHRVQTFDRARMTNFELLQWPCLEVRDRRGVVVQRTLFAPTQPGSVAMLMARRKNPRARRTTWSGDPLEALEQYRGMVERRTQRPAA